MSSRFHLRSPTLVLQAVTVIVLGVTLPAASNAQTDYYNTDKGRPITIEDAYATERYAFELQVAPLRLERSRGGLYRWGVEPELTYGILPRTHLEIGAPLAYLDVGSENRSGLAGLNISLLHNLNVETTSLPALGFSADVLMPVGGLAGDRTYASIKGIVTRTIVRTRVHLNGQYTFGDAPSGSTEASAVETSRWLAGVALDRTFPLKAMLVTADVFARQSIHDGEPVEWNAGGGVRYQFSPQLSVDAGLGKRLTGNDQSWFVTFGLARAFAIRALMPR